MNGFNVFYLDEKAKQVLQGYYRKFIDAQRNRDELIAQGYEAWIEEAEE